MILPRQFALAEVLWTGPRTREQLPEFRIRATHRARVLKARGFNGPFVTVDTRPWHEAGATIATRFRRRTVCPPPPPQPPATW